MEDTTSWKGIHVSQLQTSLNHSLFPDLVSHEEHTILFRIPVHLNRVPECFPSIFNRRDYWDSHHVKLPCSEKNITREQISRWTLIRDALNSQISSSWHLQAAILNYNARYAEQWNFSALHSFFEEVMHETETEMFFVTLLPKIIDLALRLPELITGGIPLLKRGRRHSVSLSQLQISCLLSNAFLCTFPHRNSTQKDAEYFDYPDINFNRLFQCDKFRIQSVHEKIKCLLNYFRRVTSKVPSGVVTYSRQFVPNNLYPNWSKSNRKLPRLYVCSEGTIEDDGFGLFQVDFANKFVGGGVIGTGCVQEEIRFVICPELILSRLFTQCLGENEALVITGCERFNKYKGYGSNFEWDGDYVDGTPCDENSRKHCTVIALDALYYRENPHDQYLPKNVWRDMNKAYVGFSWGSRRKKEELCAVATGNWGCGAFKGDPELKSFVQLMAAAEVGRDLAYFTFGDTELRDGMASVHQYLVENEVTIGKLYSLLAEYNSKQMFKTVTLFEFFKSHALKKVDVIEAEERKTFYVFLDLYFSLVYVTSQHIYHSRLPRMINLSTHFSFRHYKGDKECDFSPSNISNGLHKKLEITKRSFCCRTKISDWFSPPDETSSSKNIDDDAHLQSEKQILTNFYRLPSSTELLNENENSFKEEDCFSPLNKFRESLKKFKRTSDIRERKKNESKVLNESATVEKCVSNTNDRSIFDEEIINKKSKIYHKVDVKLTRQSENACLDTIRNSKTKSHSSLGSDQSNKVQTFANTTNACTLSDASAINSRIEETSPHGIEVTSQNEFSDDVKKLDIECVADINNKTEKFEKQNTNLNCDISSTASCVSEKSEHIRTNTPQSAFSRRLSLKRSSVVDSNTKRRKISDYFNPKP